MPYFQSSKLYKTSRRSKLLLITVVMLQRYVPEEALVVAKPSKVDVTAEADNPRYVDPRDGSVEEEAKQSEEEEQSFVLGWEERFTGEEDVGERAEGKQTAATDMVAGNGG